ncbi:hypothetical protein EX30DRAFT_363034 [Ascodesmis nigricans]|uniref:Transmembrane protein n=1 Tax=Ascodesmis nigricans TaxID=341454 RepID=A0A4S2N0L8_9PEZI|nr:hypothetical protein EX30DRAFT_363034 [Ascodesmis nigricans]
MELLSSTKRASPTSMRRRHRGWVETSSRLFFVLGVASLLFLSSVSSVAIPQGSLSLNPPPNPSVTASIFPNSSQTPSPTSFPSSIPTAALSSTTPAAQPKKTLPSHEKRGVQTPTFAVVIGIGVGCMGFLFLSVGFWVWSTQRRRNAKALRKNTEKQQEVENQQNDKQSPPNPRSDSGSVDAEFTTKAEKTPQLDVAPSLLKKLSTVNTCQASPEPAVTRPRGGRDSAIGGINYDPEIWGESWRSTNKQNTARVHWEAVEESSETEEEVGKEENEEEKSWVPLPPPKNPARLSVRLSRKPLYVPFPPHFSDPSSAQIISPTSPTLEAAAVLSNPGYRRETEEEKRNSSGKTAGKKAAGDEAGTPHLPPMDELQIGIAR